MSLKYSSQQKWKTASIIMSDLQVIQRFEHQDASFNGRLQYRCLDTEFTRPMVEQLLFPTGRLQEIDFELGEEIKKEYMKKLSNLAITSDMDFKSRKERTLRGDIYNFECQLLKIDPLHFEKFCMETNIQLSYEGKLPFVRHFRKIAVKVELKQSREKLEIKPIFEKMGFDVILEVSRTAPMLCSHVKTDLSDELQIAQLAVRKIFDITQLTQSYKVDGAKQIWIICILMIYHLTDHLATLRYIREKFKEVQKQRASNKLKCVVVINKMSPNILTTKELERFYMSQEIYVVWAESLGESVETE